MPFGFSFGGNKKEALPAPTRMTETDESKVNIAEIKNLLVADANSMEELEARYASLLVEYHSRNPSRVKQFPTYLGYAVEKGRETLDKLSDVLKARESCIDHSLRLHSKYGKELEKAKLPAGVLDMKQLLSMKEEIHESRNYLNAEEDHLNAALKAQHKTDEKTDA